jgi:hypothetical protein
MIRLRLVKKEDSEWLFALRNDSAAFKNFLNPHFVQHPEHEVWLNNVLGNNKHMVYIAYDKKMVTSEWCNSQLQGMWLK